MYVMVCTKLDIAHAVGVVNRYMSNSEKQYWETVKWILRYLRGSSDCCLYFTISSLKFQGYVDANLASDVNNEKSITNYGFALSGTAVSWGF